MSNLKYYQHIIPLLTITALTVYFTDMMMVVVEKNHDDADWCSFTWTTALLCISSVSPWNIPRLFMSLLPDISSSRNATKKQDKKEYVPSLLLETSPKAFAVYELIHDLAGLGYHLVNMPFFVWMAMINFPLMYAHLDRAMLKKHRSNSREAYGPPEKRKGNHSQWNFFPINAQDPFVTFSQIVYIFGIILRRERFILSGSGLIALSVPLTRHDVSFKVAVNMIPLSIIFVLEHYSIMTQMHSLHLATHTISHFAIHKATHDLYVHCFSDEKGVGK